MTLRASWRALSHLKMVAPIQSFTRCIAYSCQCKRGLLFKWHWGHTGVHLHTSKMVAPIQNFTTRCEYICKCKRGLSYKWHWGQTGVHFHTRKVVDPIQSFPRCSVYYLPMHLAWWTYKPLHKHPIYPQKGPRLSNFGVSLAVHLRY